MTELDTDLITREIGRVFHIQDVTTGDGSKYLVRYRGHLLSDDGEAARRELSERLRPHDVTPVFRMEEGVLVIYIVRAVVSGLDTELYTREVERVFRIEDVTAGEGGQVQDPARFRIDEMTDGDGSEGLARYPVEKASANRGAARNPAGIPAAASQYLMRYRGQLLSEDSEAAYGQLFERLRPHDVTPLFRVEQGKQVIYIVRGALNPRPSNVRTNIIMFALTVYFVFMAGAMYGYHGPLPPGGLQQFIYFATHFYLGWQFGLSLLAILLAHEFGHYIAARLHGEPVTLPYFVPLPPPIGFFGTMGAVIQMKSPVRNRRNLLDIGVAGPLAGLVVAIPLLLYGLSISKLGPVQPNTWMEGNSILYLFSKFLVFGRLLPSPETYHGVAPALYWLRYFATGHPIPSGGLDVQLSPVAWAAWGGLLVTALNLIPAGMLDGGHLMYVLMGKRMRMIYPFIIVALLLLGLVWYGWWLWAFLLLFLGRLLDSPLDQITTLNPGRRALAVAGIVIFFLVFMPVPLIQI